MVKNIHLIHDQHFNWRQKVRVCFQDHSKAQRWRDDDVGRVEVGVQLQRLLRHRHAKLKTSWNKPCYILS